MAQFSLSNFSRFILDTEDDSESPLSQEYMQEIRHMLVGLLLLMLDTNESGTLTSDPPNDNTGKLEDTAASFSDDEFNGMTVLITSGDGKGLFYTIDDVIAADDALYCTGDNLYSDGVRSGDSYKILYDLKANLDGHDHDGVNSKGGTVADSAITQAKLKTTTGTVGGLWNQTLSGGEYGFYPRVYSVGNATDAHICDNFTGWGTPTANIYFTDADARAVTRYVQSSGEVHWIFLLRDRATRKVLAGWEAPDHPCMGNGGKPEVVAHPFPDYDSAKHEIVVINPSPEEVRAMREACVVEEEGRPDRQLIDVIFKDYEVDDAEDANWPDRKVTVALPRDWEDAWLSRRPVTPIKKRIPRPEGILCKKLKKKNSGAEK